MTISQVTDTLIIGDWQDAARISRYVLEPTVGWKIMTVAFDSPFTGDIKFNLVDGPADGNLDEFERAVDKLTELQNNKIPTLIHCVSGVSRSAAVVIAYLMRSEKISYGEAFARVQNRRPSIKPVPFFEDYLSKSMWDEIAHRFLKQ